MTLPYRLTLMTALVLVGCQGVRGEPGPEGPVGDAGPQGDAGAATACPLAPQESPVLTAQISVAPPQNGQFFVAGERAQATVRFQDGCGNTLRPSELKLAQIYLAGPRQALAAKTALKLLNATGNRAAADHQHHFVSLKSPSFADPTQGNLTVGSDGVVTYRLSPVTDEAAGTYTLGVWAKAEDERAQVVALSDLQIGSASVETYSSGAPETASCLACHQGQRGKVYMHHTFPGYSPLGDFALDSAPVGSCMLCHNGDGYSPNPLLRKVHGIHRGEHLLAPGAAHPEYSLPGDLSLLAYTNVGFASTPDHEKDCAKCHSDTRWQTRPSRMACGTCHDNLFFDTGSLTPPRVFGKPGGVACVLDAACASYGSGAVCNVVSGNCERQAHAPQADDSQCGTCHGPTNGVSPIVARHDIPSRTLSRGLRVTNVVVSGGTGAGGVFQVGDHPVVTFKVSDRNGANVGDILTTGTLSGTAVVSGPNDVPHRVYASATMAKNTALTYSALTQTYTYTFPGGWPANNVAPLNNSDPAEIHANPAGSYSIYIYVVETLPSGARDSVGVVSPVRFVPGGGAATFTAVGRETIEPSGCNSCHVDIQAHGGSRSDPEGCHTCHNRSAKDRAVGSNGGSCATGPTACPGYNGNPLLSWEDCPVATCVMTQDPTPNQTVDYGPMLHMIHYARRLGGYSERNNLVPGLRIVGYQNTANDFSEVLFPQDIRNCTKCHADSNASCSTNAPCNVGQSCLSGKCVNTSWQVSSTRICLSCHDTGEADAHAAANTGTIGGKPVETCEVCHGAGRELGVDVVHNVSRPYVPPYPREAE